MVNGGLNSVFHALEIFGFFGSSFPQILLVS